MNELYGVLPIDKPAGMTSRDVVNVIQRLVRPMKAKVGHTGTLDPLATGVLLLAVGRATRLVEFSHGASKEYQATFQLGVTSPSLDTDTEVVVAEKVQPVRLEDLNAASARFQGRIWQRPPAYSAVHVDGKRAYELARQGKDVEIPMREVCIDQLDVNAAPVDAGLSSFDLRTVCSTGTYIRTLGDDLAQACGSRAVMSSLQRTRVGSIPIGDCVPLACLDNVDAVFKHLVPADRLVAHMQRFVLTISELAHVKNGRRIAFDSSRIEECAAGQAVPARATSHASTDKSEKVQVAAIDDEGRLAAILSAAGDYWRADKVFATNNPATPPSKTNTPHKAES
jgi:tRNA pseudouridine55 synthase